MEPWQYVVLLGAVAAVAAVVLPGKKDSGAGRPEQTMRNMETALEQFMENMEADNREMVELLAKAKNEAREMALKREERIVELEKRCAELEQSLLIRLSEHAQPAAPVAAVRTVDSPSQPGGPDPDSEGIVNIKEPAQAQHPLTIRRRFPQLFELYDAGKSVEAVARKLGMNKGEVQLILQLSKQEEATGHD